MLPAPNGPDYLTCLRLPGCGGAATAAVSQHRDQGRARSTTTLRAVPTMQDARRTVAGRRGNESAGRIPLADPQVRGGDIVARASGSDGYRTICDAPAVPTRLSRLASDLARPPGDPLPTPRPAESRSDLLRWRRSEPYVRFFKDTEIETIVNDAQSVAPIGGTSAGLAILSEFSYAALNDSVTTDTAVADPSTPTCSRPQLPPFMAGPSPTAMSSSADAWAAPWHSWRA